MGNLVFQATLGGQVNLVGPNTASTFNINVPTVNGNMVTTGDTGTVTNTMCATSVYTAPGTIGSGTPNTGAFTTLSASGVATISAGSASAPALTTSGDTNTGMLFPGADTIAWTTGGSERLRLDSSGNLGLGVTPSAWLSSTVATQIGNYGSVYAFKNSGNVYLNNNTYVNSGGSDVYLNTAPAGRYRISDNTHIWYNAPSGTAGTTATLTQAMTLDASGNLGLGSTSPNIGGLTRALTLNTPTGGNYSGVELAGAGTLSARFITNNAAGTFIGSQLSIPLVFETNATERARITSSGELLVGTTSLLSGGERLAVKSSAGDWNTILQNNYGSTPYGLLLQYTSAAPNGTSNYFFYADDTSQVRFYVRSNGGIGNFSANNINLSDRREKTNFAPAGDYLAKICAIPVQTFNFIDQNLEEDGGLTLGVVAQDVQAVAPELVTESNWAKEGDEPKMRLSIYQTDLQYALMKCIQEQQAIIETLTNRITALEQA